LTPRPESQALTPTPGRGIAPRVFLGIWQTLFMVTGAKLLKDELRKRELVT